MIQVITGIATPVGEVFGENNGGSIGGITYDADSQILYGLERRSRSLVMISLVTAQPTLVGETHSAAEFGGKLMRTIGLVPPTDIDSDGVTDEVDACQESDLTPTVVVEGCDSGVDNVLFDDGCSLADLVYDALAIGSEEALEDLLDDLEDQHHLTDDESEAVEDCTENRKDDDKDDDKDGDKDD